ncbi:retrotransposon protein, putative, ty1-copia subclass [Tanacetum coccineum]
MLVNKRRVNQLAAYVLKMKGYVEQLERLGYMLPQDLSVGLILNGLTSDFDGFGLRGARKLKQGALYLYMGNGVRAQVEAIRSFDLVLPNGLVICLDNCHYAPTITRGVVSVHHLVENGFVQRFTDYGISISKNDVLYFNVFQSNGMYEIDMHDLFQMPECIENAITRGLLKSLEWCLRVKWENQLGKTIKALQLDRGDEYISQEFKDYLKACGIVQQLTPPYTPQHNCVSERRNHTLLDMVRSVMNLTTLPLSFWDYALESATHILNMVPTKKVDKTPYELWYGKKFQNLSYLMVWGCGALMKRITLANSTKILYAEFFEKSLITQRAIDLEEIQDEDTSPFEITSEIPMEVEGFEPPQEELIPIHRSERTHRAPTRLCLNVEAEEHSLGYLNEPTIYKAAMLDPESNKWLDAMNAEIQSMIDNKVWVLVDLPPNCKTVGSKWIFKKKTYMDGIVHTYKAHLVAKGYTQLYEVDYEETFSPVTDIRAIRILISIAVFYDYEIWKMDVKTTFLNGYLDEDIYMVQPEGEATFILGIKIYRDSSKRLIGLSQSAYMDKILKRYRMDNSKCGHIPMQERLDLNKTQGASTPEEVKRMQNVTYASINPGEPRWTAVKSILKYLRNTKDMFLVYGGNPEAELRVDCYCDVGFETDRDDIKSQTRYVFILNGGAVDSKSSKQSTTAMSTTEAEYVAALEAVIETVWIRKFILGLGKVPTINEPIKMFCDNSAVLLIANESGVQKGARHYHRRYHYVRECIELGEINLLKVHTDDNLADPFTKALPKGKLTQHARSIGLRLASSFM